MKYNLVVIAGLLIALSLGHGRAMAGPSNPILAKYLQSLKEEVQKEDPAFREFSAERGKELYFREFPNPDDPKQRSCATCHTKDAKAGGSHYDTGKPITPLAPSVNPERLTDVEKMEKWFKRNSKWVRGQPCGAREKGDFLSYLLNL